MEIELGKFFIDRGDDGEVEMRLMDTKFLDWKYGLVVEGIEVRLKNKLAGRDSH